MSQLMTRRSLLRRGVKSGVGLILLSELRSHAGITVAATHQEQTQLKDYQPAYKRLDEFIARHMAEMGAPGLTLAIANRSGSMRVSHYGFADLKTGVRVGHQTMFQIGSISKSFVAIAALKLADEGKLDLQKPVSSYLPWLKIESTHAPFTTHHLLSHTAGLSGVPLLTRIAATPLRTGFQPGSRFVYSNLGYALLGFLLEAQDKQPFADVLRKRVLEPLGMSASSPIITNGIRERIAIGYAPFYDDRPFPLRGKLGEAPWVEVPEAAGSVAATAQDMVSYLQMLLNNGIGPRGRVLSEKSFELLIKPVIKAPFGGEEANYSYGLWISDTAGLKLARHTGGMIAFSSAMHADLTSGFGVLASVNANLRGYRPNAVAKYALDLLRAVDSGSDLPQAPPSPPAPDRVQNAADYAGTYKASAGTELVLTGEGERLLLHHRGQKIALEPAGRDRFLVKHPDFELFVLGFGRQNNTVVEAFHGSDWWRNERYTGPEGFDHPKEWEAYTGHFRCENPWYGSLRIVLRKGRLLMGGQQPLIQVESGVFRPDGDVNPAERLTFRTIINGKALHLNFSGIDYYRTFTP